MSMDWYEKKIVEFRVKLNNPNISKDAKVAVKSAMDESIRNYPRPSEDEI